MPETNGELRVCPTRVDRVAALFTHKVTGEQCQSRQRGKYHKCYTCAFNNAYVAQHGMPAPRVDRSKPEAEVEAAVAEADADVLEATTPIEEPAPVEETPVEEPTPVEAS